MNTDQIYNLIQKLIVLAAGGLIAKGIGDSSIWEGVGGAVAGFVTWYISHKWNATPVAAAGAAANKAAGSQAGFARLGLMLFVSALSAFVLFLIGCAATQPGQDPIVVNTERAQQVAAPTFDVVLGLDNSNRELWKSKAPAFHEFCEWLRQLQAAQLSNGTVTNVQRAIAMQLNLDKIKLDYKASKVSSNAVLEAIATLESAEQQANSWMLVLTNDSLPFPVQPPTTLTNPAIVTNNPVLIIPPGVTLEKP